VDITAQRLEGPVMFTPTCTAHLADLFGQRRSR
jgi:hypothetical protein